MGETFLRKGSSPIPPFQRLLSGFFTDRALCKIKKPAKCRSALSEKKQNESFRERV
jgi:hypothetical protein